MRINIYKTKGEFDCSRGVPLQLSMCKLGWSLQNNGKGTRKPDNKKKYNINR